MSMERLTDEAKGVVVKYQEPLPEKPVDIVGMAKAFGCKVEKSDLPWKVSGEITHKDGVFSIRLNKDEPEARQRFTCAHELAHFLLHKEEIKKSAVEESIMLRSWLSNPQEVEANKMAADLLMPMDCVHEAAESGNHTINSLAALFGVSRQAMLVRLGIPEYFNLNKN